MSEFKIEFFGVPETKQVEISKALQSLKPSPDCVEDYSPIVKFQSGKYSIGYRTSGGVKVLPYEISDTEPAGIAMKLKELLACW
jgi:hypothetical protein